ncbi:MAG: hypothetical protein AAGL49_01335 [Pseudomonadota bacterium]
MAVAEQTGPIPAPVSGKRDEAYTRQVLQILVILFGNLLWFVLLRNGTDYVAFTDPSLIFVWTLIVGAAAGAFAWVRFDGMPVFARRFLRASAIFLAFYFFIEPFAMPRAALPPDHPAMIFHQGARWAGFVIALLGFIRPSAVFAAAMVLWIARDLNSVVTGFYFSDLDIRNVAEVISFVAGGLVLIHAGRSWERTRTLFQLDAHIAERAGLILLAAGIGGHLGNYFYSALAKLALDGGVFSWLFGNRLHDGLLGALERGTLPVAFSPWLTQLSYDFTKLFNYPMLWASFAAQAFAIVAPYKRKWVIGVTVAYDIFHVVVYASFGLLFWKWVALNAIILSTLVTVREGQWTRSVAATCFAFVLLGSPFFKTATLAWYDVANFVTVYFEAETKDGERYRAPPAYFHSASYQMSQGRLYVPPETGHFNFNIWGSVLTAADRDAARACQPPDTGEPWEERYGPLDAVSRYIERHHNDTLKRIGPDGTHNYYLVPHHHVPSFGIDDPFYTLDKREIRSYFFVFESVCLDIEDGRLQRKVMKRSEFPVYEVPG